MLYPIKSSPDASSNDLSSVSNMQGVGHRLVSAQQAAHEQLRRMILAGGFEAGHPLRQEDLAQRLGLSRVPIREALNRLATEGLVELKPRRGFYVVALDGADIEDIFDMRALLEARAGKLATELRTASDAAAVDELVVKLDEAVERQVEFSRYAALNLRFHERLFQSCGRKHLQLQISQLRNAVGPAIRMLAAEEGELRRAQSEHRDIARQFRAGDADEVAGLCAQHCAYTARALIARLGAATKTTTKRTVRGPESVNGTSAPKE